TGLPLTPGVLLGIPIVALPPDDEPYRALRKGLVVDKDAKQATCDFDLPRGVWLQGQVKDKATGRGAQAQLRYFSFTEWKIEGRQILSAGEGGRYYRDPYKSDPVTDKEGKFRFLA